MGCTPSAPYGKPAVSNMSGSPGEVNREDDSAQNGHVALFAASNSPTQNGGGDAWDAWQAKRMSSKIAPQMNGRLPSLKSEVKGSKSIAFEVDLDSNSNNVLLDSKKIPKRLKPKLDPFVNGPTLTADMLEERQRIVEQNRRQELEKKKQASRQSSRLRKNILQARQFENQQEKMELAKLEEKQLSAGKNRENQLAALAEKKRIREERAKQAKLQAQQKKLEAEKGDLDFELEKDEDFNDDGDSWLGDNEEITVFHSDLGEHLFSASGLLRATFGSEYDTSQTERVTSGTQRVTSGTERIYSGRESPAKKFNPRSSAEIRARMSAGTTDSFDCAFQRTPPIKNSSYRNTQPVQDDFFDT